MSSDHETSEEKASYEVGYKKPPAAHRFRKGQSGNPSGREKSKKKLSAYEALLLERIRFQKEGKVRSATSLEVGLDQMLAAAVKSAKVREAKDLAELFEKFGVADAGVGDSHTGGVIRQPLQFMPPRMEDILAMICRKPWTAENIAEARKRYLEEHPFPASFYERRDRILAYPDLEEGSEHAAAAWYKDKYDSEQRVVASKECVETDPIKDIVRAFADKRQAIKEGGKQRRMTSYQLVQLLLRRRIIAGDGAAIKLTTKRVTSTGASRVSVSQGVMRAPPEQPLWLLPWEVEMHNAHNEQRPTLESIMLPTELILAELYAKKTGENLPPWFNSKLALLEKSNQLGPEAEARIEWLKQNPPDPYSKYRSLRPEGWRPPQPPRQRNVLGPGALVDSTRPVRPALRFRFEIPHEPSILRPGEAAPQAQKRLYDEMVAEIARNIAAGVDSAETRAALRHKYDADLARAKLEATKHAERKEASIDAGLERLAQLQADVRARLNDDETPPLSPPPRNRTYR